MKVDELLIVIIVLLSLIILYKIFKGSVPGVLIEGQEIITLGCYKLLNGLDRYNCLYKNGLISLGADADGNAGWRVDVGGDLQPIRR